MTWFMYGLVAAGYHTKSGKFWDSALWPMQLGKLIASAIRRYGL